MADVGKIHEFSAFNPAYLTSDDELFNPSSTEQKRVERVFTQEYNKFLEDYMDIPEEDNVYSPVLLRKLHISYITRSLQDLGKAFQTLDASRPWFCYWGLHSLRLLEAELSDELASNIITFLKTCESPTGGYGGGPGQYPHLAPTYGAVMALISIGTEEAFASINRKTLRTFILSLKQPDGSFCLHAGGETDIRGAYCALAVASVTNILDDEIMKLSDTWLISCQTYEGGFGGEPGAEAHGGYTFCGVASLMILGKAALMHTPSLLKWLANKQMKYEGGFQGRTNKLVDGCYSFWQAAVFLLLEVHSQNASVPIGNIFHSKALQEFILVGCQDKEGGGLRDKPEKSKDLYHTCYVLSGLSVAQSCSSDEIVGGQYNLLPMISPLYNVCKSFERKARDYFENL